MKITIDHKSLLETYPYLEVGSRSIGQNNSPEILHKILPIYFGEYENVNTDIDLLIITSDLQGIAEENGQKYLLGEKLPSFLKTLIEIELPKCKKIGVLLCGDLYTSLEKRGASGDVRKVWEEFNNYFEWVVGIAGNHDTFGNESEKEQFKSQENIHILHKEKIALNGMKIGGISGIIGRKDKVNRVQESDFLNGLTKLSQHELDFILIHETPDFPKNNEIGNSKIREHIEKLNSIRICCGHCNWDNSLANFDNGTQILNVDSKVILMKIKRSEQKL
ncbi:metallophosphoesterase [Flammeovirga sp. OC4]|uniref:metallophosphoesterase n=1 Tax=Flammeovirga sp. OC4 TaxID=1382345 RepID=UPI0005C76C17|nr:metallophosphoesterase [Flammeovirga sp. OC4]